MIFLPFFIPTGNGRGDFNWKDLVMAVVIVFFLLIIGTPIVLIFLKYIIFPIAESILG